MKRYLIPLLIVLSLTLCLHLDALLLYTMEGQELEFSLPQLRALKQESFSTNRTKNNQPLVEKWAGLNLQNWLASMNYNEYQSIRFESTDNYMIRIHRAELDSMPGYIALSRKKTFLDSSEVRLIFPSQRDMYWVRGLARIYLEDFKPAPPPRQIFIWENETAKLSLLNEPKPFTKISGYSFDAVMQEVFHTDAGSVIIVSRDGLKARLEYPKHLQGSVLEKKADGTLNLKSPVIPAGMWLKDIVYLQCGTVATIRSDYLYRLPALRGLLTWKEDALSDQVIRVRANRQAVSLESLSDPDQPPLTQEEWLELP